MSVLGSILNAPGKLAEGLCDAILPDELEFVGDIAGGVASFYTGNWVGVAEHALDLADGAIGGKGLVDRVLDMFRNEPEPPPGANTDKLVNLMENCFSILAKLLDRLDGDPSGFGGGASGGAGAGSSHGASASSGSGAGAPALETTTRAASVDTRPAAQATPEDTRGDTQAPRGTEGKPGEGAVPQDADAFLDLARSNPNAFMRMVREGQVPQSVFDSPAAMNRLEANMQHIAQMNSLMTNMLQMYHQMMMATINNIRA